MARQPRLQFPGAIYHVGARGNRRQRTYLDDRDYARFLAMFDAVVARLGWRCHSYCLMPNHYHLLIETPGGDVSDGMHRLNGLYAQWFNKRYDLDGHLFQGRFHDELVTSDAHLLEVARYIVLNPVRAGLCALPGGWRWSSYRAAVGAARRPPFLALDWLGSHFGRDRQSAARGFAAFVADAPPARPKEPRPIRPLAEGLTPGHVR